ncbi:unnamed protein product [Phaeothamnion confervicola]
MADETLDDVLPVQQRVIKYLTDDRLFAAQLVCSIYYLANVLACALQPSGAPRGCYEGALVAVMLKNMAAVFSRLQRILVPHLLYEPERYGKFRDRVTLLAADPAVQSLVYCTIFLLLPLGRALAPLALREAVYLACAAAEILGLAAPRLHAVLAALLERPLAALLTGGNVKKLRAMDAPARRSLLGRRVAQLSLKLELALIGALLLRVYAPGVIGPSRVTFAAKFVALGAVYVQLLAIKNAQLGDDIKLFRGLRVGGVPAGWLDSLLDSVLFSGMLGVPWWLGLLVPAMQAMDPRGPLVRQLRDGGSPTKMLRERLFDLIVGRDRSKEDDEEEEAESDGSGGENAAAPDAAGSELHDPTGVEGIFKVARVAVGLTND